MKKLDAAYLAAAIDGEGSITFKSRKDVRENMWAYDLRVYISNTNKPWLEDLQRLTGGTIGSSGKPKPNRKQGYRLQIDGKQAKDVISTVLPYLRLKVAQAKLLLAHKTFQNGKYGKWHKGKQVLSLKKDRIKAFLKMRALNKRGTGE